MATAAYSGAVYRVEGPVSMLVVGWELGASAAVGELGLRVVQEAKMLPALCARFYPPTISFHQPPAEPWKAGGRSVGAGGGLRSVSTWLSPVKLSLHWAGWAPLDSNRQTADLCSKSAAVGKHCVFCSH